MLETYEPFHIKSISVYTETLNNSGIICINPNGCAEVIYLFL